MFLLTNLKIGWRLGVSFGSLLGCLLLIGVIGVNRMGAINEQVEQIVKIDAPMMDASSQLEIETRANAIQVLQMFIASKDAYPRIQEQIAANEKRITEELAKLEVLVNTPEEKALLSKVKSGSLAYVSAYRKAQKSLADSDDKTAAVAIMGSEVAPVYEALKADLKALSAIPRNIMAQAPKHSADLYQMGGNVILGFSVLATLVGFGFSIFVTRSITGPINEAVIVAQTVAAGDLTSEIHTHFTDETGQLLRALKNMNDSLVKIVGEVRSGTDAIATSSGEIAHGNQDLSNRTEQQAASLEETASSMDELTTTVRQNADNAQEANRLATTAAEVAVKGGSVVAEVVSTMGAINDSSKKIVDIIAVIDGIAFQTNILALNAAVEAARAGEQGRGFAVVASEVRTLAQRSAAAAKEIKELISDSVDKVSVGTKLVDQAGATMDEVVSSIHHVTSIMGEIMSASRSQTSGIEQVNHAVMEMDNMTQQNAALVEQAAAAASSMQEQAHGLSHVVDMFKLKGAPPVARAAPKLQAVATPTQRKPAAPRIAAAAAAPKAPRKIANTKTDEWEEF